VQFQQALEKDPSYALAYVGLADCYILLEQEAVIPTSEALPKARAAVQRALQIDNSLAEAHASLANIEQNLWNFSEAEREYKRAIELNRNYATAHHWYSNYLWLVSGRFDEAMAEIRLAQQLDPLSPIISINVAAIHGAKGELDAAIEAAKKTLELDPNFFSAHYVLGVAYRRQGRYDEAIAESEKAVEVSGRQSWGLANLGQCYAVAGNRDKARALLRELEEKYDRGEALGQNLADIQAVLGDKERAFAYLEKDYQARSGPLPLIAYSSQKALLRDKLSSDPRWNDLLRRIGLPQN
jgi:tetratricopeptide (TPR) repeat protein